MLSRCLQFNLKNLSAERITEHLQFVLGEEQVPFEEAALWSLARAADGSMRDALSLLDRLIAAASGTLTARLAEETLGLPDAALIAAVTAAAVAAMTTTTTLTTTTATASARPAAVIASRA